MYSAACLKAVVHIKNYRIRALLDNRSKVNVINKVVADNLGLIISPCREISLIDANKKKVTIEGIIENVSILIRIVIVVQAFLVIGRTNKPLILGTLFMAATRFQMNHNEHRAIEITFINLWNGWQVVLIKLIKLIEEIKNSPTSLITNNYIWREMNNKRPFQADLLKRKLKIYK